VIDDASTDETQKVARAAGATVLPLPFSLGAWGAIQTGLRYASKHGFNTALTMDADGQHEADSIQALLAPLASQQCDVVVGAYPQRGSLLRRIAWTFFRKVSGIALEDLTSGLRAYNRPDWHQKQPLYWIIKIWVYSYCYIKQGCMSWKPRF